MLPGACLLLVPPIRRASTARRSSDLLIHLVRQGTTALGPRRPSLQTWTRMGGLPSYRQSGHARAAGRCGARGKPSRLSSAGDLGVFRIANIPGVPNPTSTDPQGSRSNNQGVPDQLGADLSPQVLRGDIVWNHPVRTRQHDAYSSFPFPEKKRKNVFDFR